MARMSMTRMGVILLAFLGVGLTSYSNTLDVPFHFDDVANIEKNLHIRVTDLSLANLFEAGTKSLVWRRPVANMSFALNYYFHRYEVPGYHVVNIIIHVLTGLFLYGFTKITLDLSSKRMDKTSIAVGNLRTPESATPLMVSCFAVFLWFVHPVHTQSVTYIVQRMNSLAAMFYVLSLLLYVKGRLAIGAWKGWPWFAGCVLSGLLALGSKEIAVTLPFFIWIYEWFFFQDLDRSWVKRSVPYIVSAVGLCSLLVFLYLGTNPIQALFSGYNQRDFTLPQRVLTESRVVMHYAGLLLFPHPSRLNLDYDFPLSHGLTEPITTVISIAIVAGAVVLAILLARKERLISFCILWFLGNLIIESSIIGLELVYEHRTYLPSMFFFVLIVLLGFRAIKSQGVRLGVLVAVVAVFSLWTRQRNGVWQDPVALWADSVTKAPYKARPHNNLGLALFEQGRIEEAIARYSEALRLKPSYPQAHNNLGAALAAKGDLVEAVEHFPKALQDKKTDAEVYNNWGAALHRLGRIEEAVQRYQKALNTDPLFAEAYNNLGLVLAEQGKLQEAIFQFSRALRIRPGYADSHVNLGVAYHRQGRLDQAIKHYAQALRIEPDHQGAHRNLAIATKKGHPERASHERIR